MYHKYFDSKQFSVSVLISRVILQNKKNEFDENEEKVLKKSQDY